MNQHESSPKEFQLANELCLAGPGLLQNCVHLAQRVAVEALPIFRLQQAALCQQLGVKESGEEVPHRGLELIVGVW